jgi:hypothetical protein
MGTRQDAAATIAEKVRKVVDLRGEHYDRAGLNDNEKVAVERCLNWQRGLAPDRTEGAGDDIVTTSSPTMGG